MIFLLSNGGTLPFDNYFLAEVYFPVKQEKQVKLKIFANVVRGEGEVKCTSVTMKEHSAETALFVGNGDRVAFLGDSITKAGDRYAGYVNLVVSGLKANGITVDKIPAGVSGNKSHQMLARLDESVLSRNPQIMLLSCGVNDVWHGPRGVELPEYKRNITAIVEKAQRAGVKVVILTATMIREDAGNDFNKKLVAYNNFLRTLRRRKNVCSSISMPRCRNRSLISNAPTAIFPAIS